MVGAFSWLYFYDEGGACFQEGKGGILGWGGKYYMGGN